MQSMCPVSVFAVVTEKKSAFRASGQAMTGLITAEQRVARK